MMQLMREVSVGRMQISVVNMNRVANSSFSTRLEFTVAMMSSVAIIVTGGAHVILHMRRMVVGHRHRRYVSARTGAANGNNRVHRSATMSGVARMRRLEVCRIRPVNITFLNAMSGGTVVWRPGGDRYSADQERRGENGGGDKSESKRNHVR